MTTTVYVFTRSGPRKGSWSRYVFPFDIDNFAQLGNDLYIRHGNVVSKVTENTDSDDTQTQTQLFFPVVHWNFNDFGSPGVTKMLQAMDVVSSGPCTLSVGGDQRNNTFDFTYTLSDGDTVPGTIVPIPMSAPSLAIKIEGSGVAWKLYAVNVYLSDDRAGA